MYICLLDVLSLLLVIARWPLITMEIPLVLCWPRNIDHLFWLCYFTFQVSCHNIKTDLYINKTLGWWLRNWVLIPSRVWTFLMCTVFILALEATQSPVHCIPSISSSRIQKLRCETGHQTASTLEIKDVWICTSTSIHLHLIKHGLLRC